MSPRRVPKSTVRNWARTADLPALATPAGVTATASHRLLLMELAERADIFGDCWPTVAQLSEVTLLADGSVRRVTKQLVEMGLLQTYLRYDGPNRVASVYRVRVPELADIQAVTEPGVRAPKGRIRHGDWIASGAEISAPPHTAALREPPGIPNGFLPDFCDQQHSQNLLLVADSIIRKASLLSNPLAHLRAAADQGMTNWLAAPTELASTLGSVTDVLQLAVKLYEADQAVDRLLGAIPDAAIGNSACDALSAARRAALEHDDLTHFTIPLETWRAALRVARVVGDELDD